jgi:hypothetical protein
MVLDSGFVGSVKYAGAFNSLRKGINLNYVYQFDSHRIVFDLRLGSKNQSANIVQ